MVERMIHSADRLEIIEALKATPGRVEAEIAGLPESTLRYRPSEDEWSIKEIVGHLRDKAEVWSKRLYQVWAQNDPVFVLFDQDAAVRERNYQEADLGPIFSDMRKFKLEMIDLLAHAPDWSRLGQWPGVGRRSLKQLAEAVLEAERAHLDQIRALKEAATATAARQ